MDKQMVLLYGIIMGLVLACLLLVIEMPSNKSSHPSSNLEDSRTPQQLGFLVVVAAIGTFVLAVVHNLSDFGGGGRRAGGSFWSSAAASSCGASESAASYRSRGSLPAGARPKPTITPSLYRDQARSHTKQQVDQLVSSKAYRDHVHSKHRNQVGGSGAAEVGTDVRQSIQRPQQQNRSALTDQGVVRGRPSQLFNNSGVVERPSMGGAGGASAMQQRRSGTDWTQLSNERPNFGGEDLRNNGIESASERQSQKSHDSHNSRRRQIPER